MEENLPVQKKIKSSEKFGALIRERWPEYILEIVVIILSISISFALDEWKDNRRRQELEELYLKELAEDIASDMNQLKEVVAETRLIVQKTESLSKLGQEGTSPGYDQFAKDVRFIFKRPRFVARDATFSDLKSTGNMQVISSFPLKNALFDYYSHYTSVVLIEAAEAEASNSLLGPYILRRLPLGNTSDENRKGTPTAISREVEFQNLILVRQSTRQELMAEYEDLLTEAGRVVDLSKTRAK
ncbi:hypothetical protein [Salmonirosea aquatica]|uniref:Uncharacterized protein n=1 Tax=Salmonirosea aquatica TaxID=2654236 RepID=A0A7C9FD63_9BACT|nr:hypothetical protein [Cytophagaceae bacterium SJW1-29]